MHMALQVFVLTGAERMELQLEVTLLMKEVVTPGEWESMHYGMAMQPQLVCVIR